MIKKSFVIPQKIILSVYGRVFQLFKDCPPAVHRYYIDIKRGLKAPEDMPHATKFFLAQRNFWIFEKEREYILCKQLYEKNSPAEEVNLIIIFEYKGKNPELQKKILEETQNFFSYINEVIYKEEVRDILLKVREKAKENLPAVSKSKFHNLTVASLWQFVAIVCVVKNILDGHKLLLPIEGKKLWAGGVKLMTKGYFKSTDLKYERLISWGFSPQFDLKLTAKGLKLLKQLLNDDKKLIQRLFEIRGLDEEYC